MTELFKTIGGWDGSLKSHKTCRSVRERDRGAAATNRVTQRYIATGRRLKNSEKLTELT